MEDVKQIIMLSPNGKPIVPTGEKMPREGTAKTHTGDKALLDIQQAFWYVGRRKEEVHVKSRMKSINDWDM